MINNIRMMGENTGSSRRVTRIIGYVFLIGESRRRLSILTTSELREINFRRISVGPALIAFLFIWERAIKRTLTSPRDALRVNAPDTHYAITDIQTERVSDRNMSARVLTYSQVYARKTDNDLHIVIVTHDIT